MKFTLPDSGILFASLSDEISLIGNSTNTLLFSMEAEFACPKIENISNTSELPIFEDLALEDKLPLRAVDITLSFVAVYFFIDII